MIIAVEAVGAKHGGGAVIAREAVAALAADEAVERVVVFASPEPERGFTFGLDPKVLVENEPQAESAAGRLEWLTRGLADSAKTHGAHVVLALNAMGTVPELPVVNYYQQPLLYDAGARAQVSPSVAARLTAIRGLTWRSAREAAAHVVQTSWMREKVSETWQIEPEEIAVAMPTPPDWDAVRGGRSDDLLWVGHQLGYKRWGLAQWIHSRWREVAPEAELRATLEEVSGRGVRALGRLDREELRSEYQRAGGLLITSMTESLGLPFLEAMATGCPIVAPDLPWAHAVCDNAALYYDPQEPATAIQRLRDVRDPRVYGDLAERMSARCDELRAADGWGRLTEIIVSQR